MHTCILEAYAHTDDVEHIDQFEADGATGETSGREADGCGSDDAKDRHERIGEEGLLLIQCGQTDVGLYLLYNEDLKK